MAAADKITPLVAELEEIIASCRQHEQHYADELAKVHPKFAYSARNLAHYRAFRRKARNRLQRRLMNLGLSRLAKAESHVLPSLHATQQLLQLLGGSQYQSTFEAPEMSIKKARRLLKRNVRTLLNRRPKRRRSRIMVTMPTEAAHDRDLIRKMLEAGMNAARINCAHDSPEAWKAMIDNIRAVSAEMEIPCVVAMDLGGPKIRTGAIEPGPELMKVRPPKNARGIVIMPADVWLGAEAPPEFKHVVPVDLDTPLAPVQLLHFVDARGKKRQLMVEEAQGSGYRATLRQTTYFETGIPLYADAKRKEKVGQVGMLPAIEGSIFLMEGDRLKLTAEPVIANHRSHLQRDPQVIPEIQCTNEQVFGDVEADQPVIMDDGKFSGIIRETAPRHLVMEITQVRGGGAKLRAGKGINFPQSALTVRGLTPKDREDLAFVVEHADIVNMSFVNAPEDVHDLLGAIDELGATGKVGVVLKIETERAYLKLPRILLAGMQTYPLGIMIARGDLALEVGWHNLALTQREIMKLCHAAHVPDIWATQVFENLAKQGVPSRAEMTDVWVAQRSECVMLNKGPFITDAIRMLDMILTKMEPYRDKNDDLLPVFERAMR